MVYDSEQIMIMSFLFCVFVDSRASKIVESIKLQLTGM